MVYSTYHTPGGGSPVLIQYEDWNGNGQYDSGERNWPFDSNDRDDDWDGLTNAREIAWGTDPGNPDSDYDGITDGDEVDVLGGSAAGFNPLLWDTNSNGISDYDQLYTSDRVNYSIHGSGASYYDWDGDGWKNPEDSHPLDDELYTDWDNDGYNTEGRWFADSDEDGVMDREDSHPHEDALWDDWNLNDLNDSEESSDPDEDGYYLNDSHPYDPLLWSDWNGDGNNDSPPPPDMDSDGFRDARDTHPTDPSLWADYDQNGMNDSIEHSNGWDTDGDGVYNRYDSHKTDPLLWSDWDFDGLNEEEEVGPNPGSPLSDPQKRDTDGDGLTDGEEKTYGTNPRDVDSDNDQATDYEEIRNSQVSSDPLNPYSISQRNGLGNAHFDGETWNAQDTDSDGIPDLVEEIYAPALNPDDDSDAEGDLDGDGITNVAEYTAGTRIDGNLEIFDADMDGIMDIREALHPTVLDKNDPTDAVLDADGDGLLNFEEVAAGLDPMDPDSFGGVPATQGLVFGYWIPALDSLGAVIPGRYTFTRAGEESPDMEWIKNHSHAGWQMPLLRHDADGDGMTDTWEHRYRLDVRKAADAGLDQEPDGLTNMAEFRLRTNPWHINSKPGQSDYDHFHGIDLGTDTVTGTTTMYTPPGAIPALPTPSTFGSYGVLDTNYVDNGEGPGGGGYQMEWSGETSTYTPTDHYPEKSEFYPMFDVRGAYLSAEYFSSELPEDPEDGDAEWTIGAMEIRVTMDEPVPETDPEATTFKFIIDEAIIDEETGEVDEWVEKDSFVIEIAPGDTEGSSKPIAPTGKRRRVRYESQWADTPGSSSLSVKDVAGPRYRKISFNGQPIPDSKPQVQDEGGQQPEETYIDAFTMQLRHSVTDVYAADEGTLLPLSLRRDYSPESYSNVSGLHSHERPDLPFGSGWRSNISSFIRFKKDWKEQLNGQEALVSDETGAVQNYIMVHYAWQRNHDDNADAKTRFDTLHEVSPGIYELHKKFGNVCRYQMVSFEQIVGNDRVNGSSKFDYFRHARLISVKDRWGNELRYEYASLNSEGLVPSRIYDPARPDRQMWIRQQGGLVTEVRAPDGATTRYHYASLDFVHSGVSETPAMTDTGSPVLIGVSHVGAGVPNEEACIGGLIHLEPPRTAQRFYDELPSKSVKYRYYLTGEADINPPDPDKAVQPYHTHIELSEIEDEMGQRYKFSGVTDLSQQYLVMGENGGWRTQHGLPLLMRKITLPDNKAVTFDGGARMIRVNNGIAGVSANGIATGVEGPAGKYRYTFTQPFTFTPYGDPENVSDKSHTTVHMAFQQLAIKTLVDPHLPAGVPQLEKTETFTFNIHASMALASTTDMSGKTTSFYYTKNHVPAGIQSQINWTEMGTSADNKTLGGDLYDDPIVEVDALGNFKTFTYTQAHRLLESVTDARWVKTKYDIDPLGRRTKETISGPFAGDRVTETWYENSTFKGFATKTVTDATATDTMPATVVLQSPDANGRVAIRSTGVLVGGTFQEQSREEMVYDRANRKRSVKDGRGLITNFSYDARGRMNGVTHPDGSTKILQYDDRGNLVEEVNENSVKTFHEYDVFNRRTKSIVDLNDDDHKDASYTTMTLPVAPAVEPSFNGDLAISTSYTDRGQVRTVTDARGKVTTHLYDNLGRLVKTDDGGFVTTFGYDPLKFGGSVFDSSSFKPNSVTDPRGVEATTVYDDLYRAIEKRVTGITGVTITTYDKAGNPKTVTDPLGRVTQFIYDVDSKVVETTFADLTKTKVSYTHAGKPWKQINELNEITLIHYDGAGRPVKMIQPAVDGVSSVSETAYDKAGNAVTAKDPLGRISVTEYDNRNRPEKVTAPPVWDAIEGAYTRPTTETEYDNLGQVVLQRDPLDRESLKFYDPAGRPWKAVNALGHAVFSTFDANSNVRTVTQKVTNASAALVDQTVTNCYDAHNRLKKTIDGEGIVNEFEYDKVGNRTLVQDGLGQKTHFTYDELSRLKTQTFANGDDWVFTYNAVHKVSQTDAAEVLTEYGYDERSRLETVTAPDLARTYGYDAVGRLLSVIDAGHAESNVGYTYDELGRIETETSRGVTHTYHYDLTGNRILAELGTGRKIQTVPDALNRPEMILETEGNLEAMSVDARATAYGYDLAGRAVILTTANGQVTENVYDELGRVTNRTLFKRMSDRSDAGVLAEFGWAYNEVGNVTAQHETWPGSAERDPQVRVTAMTYDLSNRLKTETVSQAVTGVVTTTYHYDAANNRKSKTVTGGAEPGHWTYDYNPANQLTAWYTHDSSVVKPEKRMALTYDANGNRTSQQRAALIVDNDAHAGLISQGIQYQAVEAGPDGEDLTISVEPGESGAGLGVSVVNNKHVKVKLAMEEAQADVLENQGITYATLTPHEPGRVVSLTLLDEGPLQSESVTVSGNDVVVRLGTDGGAPASATNQGMTFTAQEFVPVETANSLSVRFEEGLPGQPASTELVGNTAVVKLAMDQGLPHTLLNQGVTYSTKAPHYADKEEVSIALTAAAGPGQAATVDVEGDEITVNLGTTSGDAASVTDQGLIYTAVTPGPGGNSLDIKLQKALDGAPLSASLNGNVVTVNLASNSGKATLEQPGITYEAVEPGAGGNDILIVYDDFTDDLYADVEVQGSTITVYPATVRIPATATLYPELSGGLVMTTTRVEEDDVPTEIQIDQSGDANSPLDIYSDGALIIVTLASGGAEQPITTLAQLATALQSYGITIVSGGNNNTIIGGGGGTVFEGGGYEIIATGDEVADLIRNDPAASALVTVVGSNSTVVTVGGSYLTGGQEPSLISTKADVLSLLNATPAISAVVSVTGDSGTPGSQILDISDLSLSGGGLNAQITTTAAQLVTLLNGAQSLVTATGSGSSALSPLSMTALTGARDPVPSSTRTQVMDLMQNLPGMPDVIEVTGDESTDIVEPASFDLSGGGTGYAIYTRVNGLVELLEGNSLITATGEGSALLNAMPRTVLTGGAPDILSTAEDVADLLAATTAVTALMAVSLVGDGEALVTPHAAQALSGVTSPGTVDVTQNFTWNSENRLATATDVSGRSHGYNYDYRMRRVATRTTTGGVTTHTAVLFNGGLSTAEYESSSLLTTIASPGAGAVHYVRGPDMGGGVGGLLYSLRTDGASRKVRYNLSNARGDIVAQSDANASLTWTASYEAYGKRTVETGTNQDKQRANSKDEDPTGLLNEGFRYRDIETGVFLSRDPAGFVDGPNLYAYVKQNPWTGFDPEGLADGHHKVGQALFKNNPNKDVQKFFNSKASRLTSDAYEKDLVGPTHGGRKLNNVTTTKYNEAVSDVSSKLFNLTPDQLDLKQAIQLTDAVDQITNFKGNLAEGTSAQMIRSYNEGVIKEINVANQVASEIDSHLWKAGSKSNFRDLTKNSVGELVDPQTKIRFLSKYDATQAQNALSVFLPKGKNSFISFFVNNAGRVAKGATIGGVALTSMSMLNSVADGQGYQMALQAGIRGDREGVSEGITQMGFEMSMDAGNIGPAILREGLREATGY